MDVYLKVACVINRDHRIVKGGILDIRGGNPVSKLGSS